MFAVSRIIRVKGRINILIVSIITIKGIKIVGVLMGTRWEKNCPVFIKIVFSVRAVQIGKDSSSVVDICLVGVKIKGKSLSKFIK